MKVSEKWTVPETAFFPQITQYLVCESEFSAQNMAMVYFGFRSGDKSLLKFAEDATDETIAGVLIGYYGDSWKRMYDAMRLDYEPIENYDRTSDVTTTRTPEITRTHQVEGSVIDNGNNSVNHGHKIEDENDGFIYGMNSSSPTPSDKNTNSQTHSGTDSETSQNTKSWNDYTETDKETGNDVTTVTDRTHGNIGVTTSQQMLQSEIDLRRKTFYSYLFSDIDKMLCLAVY